MKAIRIHEFGGPEVLKIRRLSQPDSRAGASAGRRSGHRRQLRRCLRPQGVERPRPQVCPPYQDLKQQGWYRRSGTAQTT